MSKSTDAARRRAARKKFAREMKLWNAAMSKARTFFWDHQALKFPNGSRFKAGTDREKHMRGYWAEVERIARENFGGKKPRPLPTSNGLKTGGLKAGGLNTGHL